MNLVRCLNGHFYDSDKNDTCPHCAKQNVTGETPHPTSPFDSQNKPPIATIPQKREEVQEVAPDNDLKDAVKNAKEAPVQPEMEKTQGIYSSTTGIDPVVGWLVCVEGPDKGADYRIKAGRNFIGRAPSMDICVKGDHAISNNKHAILAYDPQINLFIIQNGDSHELFYLNGKIVLDTTELKNFDRLKIGRSLFMLVQCCNENFKWED